MTHNVNDGDSNFARLAFPWASDVHETPCCLNNDVIAWLVGIWARGTIPSDGHIDETRVDLEVAFIVIQLVARRESERKHMALVMGQRVKGIGHLAGILVTQSHAVQRTGQKVLDEYVAFLDEVSNNI